MSNTADSDDLCGCEGQLYSTATCAHLLPFCIPSHTGDFAAIASIGQDGKMSQPAAIGRFGLGFNSV